MGIMVGGRLRCLGSAQHLKSRFGMGYQTEIAVHLPEEAEISAALSKASWTAGTDVAKADAGAFLLALGVPEYGVSDRAAQSHTRSISPALSLVCGPWQSRIALDGSGADVFQSFESRGLIGAKELASWVLLEQEIDNVMAFIAERLPGSVLRERQGAKVRYEIPGRDASGKPLKLSTMFGTIEGAKADLHIDDYSLSQTSLEQIFNFFASQQEEEQGAAAGIAGRRPSLSQIQPVATADAAVVALPQEDPAGVESPPSTVALTSNPAAERSALL
jgi:ATP-binding cassette, subfamily A (ABC1), member 3